MSEGDGDAKNRLKKPRNASVQVCKRSKRRKEENSPGRTQVNPYDPGDNVDMSVVSWSIEEVDMVPRKLQKVLEPKLTESKRAGIAQSSAAVLDGRR